MTKRFTYVKNNSITQYQALPIQEIGKSKALHCQGVVDKLNKLSDENEELQQSLLSTSKELQYGVKKVQRLAKENEQLKKQIERIDFILDDLNGAEYISRDDGIKALNKIDKVIGKR